jgi:hypothetical protein
MKWIVVAILAVIIPYTILTLRYRKPGPAFEPYADLKDRANTKRLLEAGFQRVTLTAQRPADPIRTFVSASTSEAAGGLPAGLRTSLIDAPVLPKEIQSVSAASMVAAAQPYLIQFGCSIVDDKQQLAGAQLYLREGEIFLVPNFERLHGDLLTRTRSNIVLLTIPAGTLKPGAYRATLLGQNSSKTWTLQVH